MKVVQRQLFQVEWRSPLILFVNYEVVFILDPLIPGEVIMAMTLAERRQFIRFIQTYAADIDRMRRSLEAAGYQISTYHIVQAWVDYSDSTNTVWVSTAEDTTGLLKTLLQHMPPIPADQTPHVQFIGHIIDLGDGSGDGILELQHELLALVGWEEGDSLYVSAIGPKELLLKRANVAGVDVYESEDVSKNEE
ncbi:hypothetical protein [Undibacterium terreum]|uniref:Uncharacterized protein n=1 Tax=Undibacterium terreum TaxID=1224302 RepID=A0A916XIY0_9BURK|nr:hypothetical protein [Undibacterium terreum]GGC75417.1 hypothetical protein GCM10011396_23330 [Undibacterium terreum]